ncbi:ATP-dependent helicase/deoxyribonuclease subunit B [Limihaloglobus sulfuriphilus]|uniref:ATP-dependent helicase/deoxyribonuclease subunit B n=1 Tax=Limihaloglobus sulfuriphilus TaxID=1851148 RepID=A0A1Q2MC60_9BACT|nr:PD-(D/E)XK nuclease family protein [Limihaloglobus sulfuriphilus]AQQ70303.1 ATP-dependent helicase/deoxyribonuclease subunit B [Limihaloglobus sulfuriphilus]
MSVQFITGRAGSGKTHLCLEQIRESLLSGEDTGNLIFLVPEQSTYIVEKMILNTPGIEGFSRLHVLSFNRLAYWLTEKSVKRRSLTLPLQLLIVSKILNTMASRLKVFSRQQGSAGLAGQILGIIDEFQRNGLNPSDISSDILSSKKLGSSTVLKLHDLKLIYAEYLKIAENKYDAAVHPFDRACSHAAGSELLKGARLWVDGFSGFNSPELTLLSAVIRAVSETKIALCADPAQINAQSSGLYDELSIFEPTLETYWRLRDIFGECGIPVRDDIALRGGKRVKKGGTLDFIEQNIFTDVSTSILDDSVKLVKTSDCHNEVEYIAREIMKLVRDGGLRYRDIAVIVSDEERFASHFKTVFSDYQIPLFLDIKRNAGNHPLTCYVLTAVDCVISALSSESIFTCLKSGFSRLDHEQISRLEKYCRENGISSGEWLSESRWQNGESRQDINLLRNEAIEPLKNFYREMTAHLDENGLVSAKEFSLELLNFIDQSRVESVLGQWSKAALDNGDTEISLMHKNTFESLLEIIAQVTDIFGEERLEPDYYASIVGDMLKSTSFALVPPCQDQVLIGTVDRSRQPEVKAVFLCGVNQGLFPSPVRAEGLLREDERADVISQGLEMDDPLSVEMVRRQYLAYIAFTRAKEMLYITFSEQDEQGRPMQISGFGDRLVNIFEGKLKPESFDPWENQDFSYTSPVRLSERVCDSVSPDNNDLKGIRQTLEFNKVFGSKLKDYDSLAAEYGSQWDNSVNTEQSGELCGKEINVDASKLSTYAKCPYMYFARYVLGLKSEKKFALEPVDIGSFSHKILEMLGRDMLAGRYDFDTRDSGEIHKKMDEFVLQYLVENSILSRILEKSRHANYIFQTQKSALHQLLDTLIEMRRAGNMKLLCVEPYISRMVCFDGVDVRLSGKIDRIDFVPAGAENSQISLVVYDYKTSARKTDWKDIFNGSNVQLLVYLLLLKDMRVLDRYIYPAAAFYMPVNQTVENAERVSKTKISQSRLRASGILAESVVADLTDPEVQNEKSYFDFRLTKNGSLGWYSTSRAFHDDDFEKLLAAGEVVLSRLVKGISQSRFDISPLDESCKYCDYRSLCRFEPVFNKQRFSDKANKNDVLALSRSKVRVEWDRDAELAVRKDQR